MHSVTLLCRPELLFQFKREGWHCVIVYGSNDMQRAFVRKGYYLRLGEVETNMTGWFILP